MNNDTAVSNCDNKMAVRILNGLKTFKGKKGSAQISNDVSVLENFNLNVPAGSLYGLLGSNGCGKTTVISIIIGQCKLDAGDVEVLTSSPALGYMPQETCLYSEFSIVETLQYFGILFGIRDEHSPKKEFLKTRVQYLRKLLLLPPEEQIVGTLSGGQKRRLSLAVALVHEPDILLLDEPTSGVDPLVRVLIWEHLTKLVNTKGTTIILTTHYVDEAKGSSIVGFMRNGQLVSEDTPSNLFEKYNVNSMETIFHAICQHQNCQNPSLNNCSSVGSTHCPRSQGRHENVKRQGIDMHGIIHRIYALVGKNYKTLVFITTIPAVWMLVTCIGYRNDPHNIALGLVNYDIAGNVTDDNMSCTKDETIDYCRMEELSCIFLESLTGNTIQFLPFKSIESATQAVQQGNIWGYVFFPQNYTDSIINRFLMGSSSYFDESNDGKAEWNNSKITVRLDQTNTLIYTKITTTLHEALENSAKMMMKSCGYDERIAEFPLQYTDPIVGEKMMTSLKYVGPGLAIEFIYSFAQIIAIRFISEKRDGTLGRCLAGGAKMWEILLSYAIAVSPILLVQSFLVILVLHFSISIFTYLANVPLVLALCLLQGLSGLGIGLLLAVVCKDECQTTLAILALLLPNHVVSGLLWPLEGLPKFVQKVSIYLPMTLSGESIRSLMIRGWNFYHPNVWQGFLITTGYITLCSFLILIVSTKQFYR